MEERDERDDELAEERRFSFSASWLHDSLAVVNESSDSDDDGDVGVWIGDEGGVVLMTRRTLVGVADDEGGDDDDDEEGDDDDDEGK